jgi:hypothetical protein
MEKSFDGKLPAGLPNLFCDRLSIFLPFIPRGKKPVEAIDASPPVEVEIPETDSNPSAEATITIPIKCHGFAKCSLRKHGHDTSPFLMMILKCLFGSFIGPHQSDRLVF